MFIRGVLFEFSCIHADGTITVHFIASVGTDYKSRHINRNRLKYLQHCLYITNSYSENY